MLCANAPVHHTNHRNDLRRVDRGWYQRLGAAADGNRDEPPVDRVPQEPQRKAAEPAAGDALEEWHWEGNVQAAMVTYLVSHGWAIKSVANTAAREHGVDILADKEGCRLAVEVKGYPSRYYVRGPSKGKVKRTAPPMQARVWFADLLMSALILLDEDMYDLIALCLPAADTYANLVNRTRRSLEGLGITVAFVNEAGSVTLVAGTLEPSSTPRGNEP